MDRDGKQKTQVDDIGSCPNNQEDSSSNCPFPLGFGPCSPILHVHGSKKEGELEKRNEMRMIFNKGHETSTCPIDGDEDDIQQADSFERGEALAVKETCEEAGVKFEDCDKDMVLSAFITKAKAKSKNRVGGIDGNQGRKKVRIPKNVLQAARLTGKVRNESGRKERKERKDNYMEPMRMHHMEPCIHILALGGTPKWQKRHLCIHIRSFYAYA
ncbi:hypothetical protein PIB30_011174 [Stylosanthes scabra]|uniref:Nudix hydrolase domain-containing protein n=1 Tax=Stylosanthes scabra TaxID=79078 RepID=A0ABU6R4M0_9FABA|nr:hypothetical protein [Stylosanthes scabra]